MLKVGDLIRICEDPQWGLDEGPIIAVVIKQNKTKKTWHRSFKVLTQYGDIIVLRKDCGLSIEIISGH